VNVRYIGVYPAGDHNVFHLLSGGKTYGRPILVAADREYDVVVRPEGGEEVVVAERVRPKGGELLVVGGDSPSTAESGRGTTDDTAPRLTIADPATDEAPAASSASGPETTMETTSATVRAATSAVGEGEMTPKVAELVTQLKSPNPNVRLRAAEQLGNFGEEGRCAIPALIDRVADMQGTVVGMQLIRVDGSRIAALIALKKLAPQRVEHALRRATKTLDFGVQVWASKTLQLMLNKDHAKPKAPSASGGFRTLGEVKTAPSKEDHRVAEPRSSSGSSLTKVDQDAYATVRSSKKARRINANRFLGFDDGPQGGGFQSMGEVQTAPSGFVGMGRVMTAPSGGFRQLDEVKTTPSGGFRQLGEVKTVPSGGFRQFGEVKIAPSAGFRTLGEVHQAR
jgi:hypothetical protein